MSNRTQNAVAIIGSMIFATVAQATDFIIPNGDISALKAAINTANGNNQNDNIILAGAGTYELIAIDNGQNGLPVITGDNGHSVLINGNNSTLRRFHNLGTAFRLVDATGTVTIANLVMTEGSGSDGGGAFRTMGNSTLQNCIFNDNAGSGRVSPGTAGGAVSNGTGTMTVTNCTFNHNKATWISSGVPVRGPGGGAIYNRQGGTITITGCTFNANETSGVGASSAASYGGAIYNEPTAVGGTGSIAITNCSFNENISRANGGAITNTGVMTVRGSTFNGNLSTDGVGFNGGGAISNGSGQLTVENCTFHDNSASQLNTTRGGAILNSSGNANAVLNITGCTFNFNHAAAANGIFTESTAAGMAITTIRDTILKNFQNLATDGANASVVSQGYNIASDNGGGFLGAVGDQINTDPQLDANGLQDNGGPTETIALLPTSPAIDKGKGFGLTSDQRGQIRPNDLAAYSNAGGGDGSDIGAFEVYDFVEPGPVFSVNTTADHDDGVCGSLDCSLREAIVAANNASGVNTINIAVTGTITLGGSQLAITDSTTVNGPGARLLAVSGNNSSRVFNFSGGTSTLSGVTVRNGFATGNAIVTGGSAGGLFNFGTLTINDCTFSNNQAAGLAGASGGGSGGSAFGGAVDNSFGGTLVVNRCTFAGNTSLGGPGAANSGAGSHGGAGGAARGAAIYNDTSSTLTLNNCTLTGNTATGGAGGNDSFGGGNGGPAEGTLYNLGSMISTSCTVSSNTGTGGAAGTGPGGAPGLGSAGLTNGGGTFTVRNTISAQNFANSGSDVKGTFVSQGYNLIGVGDFATGFNGTADQVGTTGSPLSANLGPWQDNGGPTNTRALLGGSLAIDKGKSFGLATDQRSRSRPLDNASISPATGGDNSDIGAFESSGLLVPISIVSRKIQGAVGAFDVDLANNGVECRSGGASNDHQLIVTFPTAVSVTGSPQISVTSGSGDIGTGGTSNGGAVSTNAAVVIIPTTNVLNAQNLGLTLFAVSDGFNTNDVAFTASFLTGDATNDRSVNSADIGQTKSKSGQTMDTTNFRNDVNADGSLNSADISLVKSRSGTALP